jgi:4-aminobutyrate aminotransferase-like enzyme
MMTRFPTNSDWMVRLSRVECRDSTWPSADPALVFDRASGSVIHDVEGRPYVDLCAGFGSLPLGHSHAVIRDVFARHADASAPQPVVHAMGDVYPSRAKIELLETLMSLMPMHLTRAALALSGSQAVEIALKTAMLATKASGFIAFESGYHGVDLGVLPVTSRPDFSAPFKHWIEGASVKTLPWGSSQELITAAARQLAQSPCGFAGVIVEPVQGRGGVILPALGWLELLAEAVHDQGGLVIFDEVFVGLGRVGRWTAAEHVPADLVCLGKALGGGFPLSACVGTTAAMDAWPLSTGEALHTGTFFGHPLSCEMGKATLEEIKRAGLCQRALSFGELMRAEIREICASNPLVSEVRGLGLMSGIEFTKDGLGVVLMDELRKRGVVALVSGARGHVLQISPALNIPEAEWKKARQALADALTVIRTMTPDSV